MGRVTSTSAVQVGRKQYTKTTDTMSIPKPQLRGLLQAQTKTRLLYGTVLGFVSAAYLGIFVREKSARNRMEYFSIRTSGRTKNNQTLSQDSRGEGLAVLVGNLLCAESKRYLVCLKSC